jgi:hypothetical protein
VTPTISFPDRNGYRDTSLPTLPFLISNISSEVVLLLCGDPFEDQKSLRGSRPPATVAICCGHNNFTKEIGISITNQRKGGRALWRNEKFFFKKLKFRSLFCRLKELRRKKEEMIEALKSVP